MGTARWATAALIAGAMLGGCTHIETHPDLTMTDAGHALPGMPYSLPMVQYQITVTRTLTACPEVMHGLDGSYPGKGGTVAIYDRNLSVSVTAAAKQRYVRGETYVVDYGKLSSWLKSTSFGIEVYPTTGTLKSIDVSAEDQTGTVVGDVVKVAVVGTALAAGGPAAGALAAGAVAAVPTAGGASNPAFLRQTGEIIDLGHVLVLPEPPDPEDELRELLVQPGVVIERPIMKCAPDTEESFAALVQQQEATKKATQAGTDAVAKVARATIIAAATGGTREAKDRSVASLADALDAQAKASDDLGKAQKKLASSRVSFDSARVVTFPRVLDEASRPIPLDGDELNALAARLTVGKVHVIDPARFAALFNSKSKTVRDALLKKHPEIEFYAKWTPPRLDTREQRRTAENQKACAPTSEIDTAVIRKCLTQLDLVAKLAFVEPAVADKNEPCPSGAAAAPDAFPTLACRRTVAETDGAVGARMYDAVAKVPKTSPGIFIREPVEGKLYLCLAAETLDCGPAHPELNRIADDPADPPTIAPQLGQLRFLPFRNGAFEKNTLHLEMSTDGSITKFGYVRPTAAAATFGDSAAAAAKQIQDARTAARDLAAKELKDQQTADVAALQFRIDVIAKRKALLEAQDAATSGAPNAAAIADLSAQATLLQGQLARQLATNQLKAAQVAGGQ